MQFLLTAIFQLHQFSGSSWNALFMWNPKQVHHPQCDCLFSSLCFIGIKDHIFKAQCNYQPRRPPPMKVLFLTLLTVCMLFCFTWKNMSKNHKPHNATYFLWTYCAPMTVKWQCSKNSQFHASLIKGAKLFGQAKETKNEKMVCFIICSFLYFFIFIWMAFCFPPHTMLAENVHKGNTNKH